MKLFINGTLFLKLFDFPVSQTISFFLTFFSIAKNRRQFQKQMTFFHNSKESKMYSEETAHSISSKENQEKIFF